MAKERFLINDKKEKLLIFGFLILCSCLFLLPLIANPGYFSHDELQRYDFYIQQGFWDYLYRHSRIFGTSGFEVPVRPLPFYVQGLHNLAFRDYPLAVHLSSTLLHAVTAFILFFICRNAGCSRTLSLTTAAIFLFNPLAILAVGWSAALMDQWYVFFSLIVIFFSQRYVVAPAKRWSLLLAIVIFTIGALLSKETAIMLPGFGLLWLLWKPELFTSKRFWQVMFACLAPVILYMLVRFSALSTSLSTSPAASPYGVDFNNILSNIFLYFSYPFHVSLTEIASWVHQPLGFAIGATIFHLIVVLIIVLKIGVRASAIYLLAYFLFLLPVLPISATGSHYLYASAIPLSFIIGYLIKSSSSFASKIFCGLAVFALAIHSLIFQFYLYDNGRCVSRLQTSAESIYLSAGKAEFIEFKSAPGAKEYLLKRFVYKRNQLGNFYPISMRVIEQSEPFSEFALQVSMNQDCIAFLDPADHLRTPTDLAVESWGPTSTPLGQVANPQPDGSMGIWIRLNQKVSGQYQVFFNNTAALHSHTKDNIITASVMKDQLLTSGPKEIFVRNLASGDKINIGVFTVLDSDQSNQP